MAVDEELERGRLEWDLFIPPARGGRWPWGSGLTLFVGLFVLATLVAASCAWAVGHFESRLEENARADLQAIGIDTEQLVFDWDYRDVSVTGRLGKDASEDQLLTVLRAADNEGVRQINLSLDTTQDPSTEIAQLGTVDVMVSLEEGQMLLEGTVLTNAQRDQLQSAAEQANGVDGVTNNIKVSGLEEQTPGSDQRVASLANSIAGLNQAVSADARLSASDFRFNATVDDEDQANDLLRLRGSAGDVGLVISGDIITKKSAPGGVVDAFARKENGRILLSGTVTSEKQREVLVRSAVNAFDEESVEDEIIVAEAGNTDADADRGIDVLASAISYFGDAIQADAHLTTDEFEFNALLEAEEDTAPLITVRDNAQDIGLALSGSIESRQMSLSREVDMLQDEITSLSEEIRENVVFESGQADLGFTAKQTLDKIVDAMNRYQRPVVQIAGHTDDSGSDDANQKLSLFRATAVVEYLKLSGIEGLRLRAIGVGESEPIASNLTEVGKSLNRRVEFTSLANFGN